MVNIVTAKKHKKILGYSLLAHCLALIIGIFISLLFFKQWILDLLYSHNAIQNMLSLPIMLLALAIVVFGVILILPQFIGGLILLSKARSARSWGIAASVFALFCLPIGTLIGAYGLWLLSSADTKNISEII